MIERVLNLNQRTVSSIMTSRHDIEHIDLNAGREIRQLLGEISIRGWSLPDGDDAEDLLGVVHVIDLLHNSGTRRTAQPAVLIRQPLVFPETCRCYLPGAVP